MEGFLPHTHSRCAFPPTVSAFSPPPSPLHRVPQFFSYPRTSPFQFSSPPDFPPSHTVLCSDIFFYPCGRKVVVVFSRLYARPGMMPFVGSRPASSHPFFFLFFSFHLWLQIDPLYFLCDEGFRFSSALLQFDPPEWVPPAPMNLSSQTPLLPYGFLLGVNSMPSRGRKGHPPFDGCARSCGEVNLLYAGSSPSSNPFFDTFSLCCSQSVWSSLDGLTARHCQNPRD